MSSPRDEYEKQRDQIEEELSQVPPESLNSRLLPLIRPAISLSTSPPGAELQPLASKLGGSPDVPPGFEWPHFDGEPLGFIAQLNLEELAPYDLEQRLPKSGLLSFWINGAWGFAKEFGSWRVFHFQGEQWQQLRKPKRTRLKKLWESKDELSFPPTPLQAEVWASLPDVWGGMEAEPEELDSKSAQSRSTSLGGGCGHQMFGFPASVQHDVRDVCSSCWNDFLDLPKAKRLGLSASRDQATWKDFELLLQVQEDDNAKMVWGDAGTIYFLIRRTDLEAKKFERCWFLLQSC